MQSHHVAETNFKTKTLRGTWLAQSVEHVDLDLRVVSSAPCWGIELLKKKKKY